MTTQFNVIDGCDLGEDKSGYYETNIIVSADGKHFYIAERGAEVIKQYSMPVAWSAEVITWEKNSTALWGGLSRDVLGLAFKSDGTKLFITSDTTSIIKQFDLTTAWDVGELTNPKELSISAKALGIDFNSDGTKMFLTHTSIPTSLGSVTQYNLSIPWNITSAVLDGSWTFPGPTDYDFTQISINSSGTKCRLYGIYRADIHICTLSTPWDITTATYDGTDWEDATYRPDSFFSGELQPYAGYMTKDELHLYILHYKYATTLTFAVARFNVIPPKFWTNFRGQNEITS